MDTSIVVVIISTVGGIIQTWMLVKDRKAGSKSNGVLSSTSPSSVISSTPANQKWAKRRSNRIIGLAATLLIAVGALAFYHPPIHDPARFAAAKESPTQVQPPSASSKTAIQHDPPIINGAAIKPNGKNRVMIRVNKITGVKGCNADQPFAVDVSHIKFNRANGDIPIVRSLGYENDETPLLNTPIEFDHVSVNNPLTMDITAVYHDFTSGTNKLPFQTDLPVIIPQHGIRQTNRDTGGVVQIRVASGIPKTIRYRVWYDVIPEVR